jgi:hypothetical protein
MAGLKHPVTPDGRHFVVRGKLWRLANPGLSAAVRSALVRELMAARSAVRSASSRRTLYGCVINRIMPTPTQRSLPPEHVLSQWSA